MRTLVIGDIHGGLKALEDVLNHVDPQPEDSFIFLGDYVDGWSQAAETVGFLINFDRHYSCHFLRGNHDDLCLQWLTEGVEYPLWLLSGGEATKNSYNGLGKETRKEHIRFLQSLLENALVAPRIHHECSYNLWLHQWCNRQWPHCQTLR